MALISYNTHALTVSFPYVSGGQGVVWSGLRVVLSVLFWLNRGIALRTTVPVECPAETSIWKKAKTMSEKPAYLTRDGRTKLEAELEELVTNGRKLVAERIGAAKELGDISESGEYEDAKNQQAHLEGRIREIKSILSRAQIIDEEKNGQGNEVRVGSKVTVRVDGEDEDETWTIVGSAEAKPREGKISNESPLGAGMLGKRKNQKVTVQTPAGQMKLTILKIHS
jgi:transcription elongation factor GreA